MFQGIRETFFANRKLGDLMKVEILSWANRLTWNLETGNSKGCGRIGLEKADHVDWPCKKT